MNNIIGFLGSLVTWKQALRKGCRMNRLHIEVASYFTPNKFKQSFQKFHKIHEKKNDSSHGRWLENQLKAFYWITLITAVQNDILIEEFQEQHWKLVQEIFPYKDIVDLIYEGMKLMHSAKIKRAWGSEEDTFMGLVVSDYEQSSNKWNEIARKLFQISQRKYFRTGKQCRQRWINHLDPTKKKGGWNDEEDRKIIQLLIRFGKKWSRISKQLGGYRTEHMIKNRHKTLQTRLKKSFPGVTNQKSLLKLFIKNQDKVKIQIKIEDQMEENVLQQQEEIEQPNQQQGQNRENFIIQNNIQLVEQLQEKQEQRFSVLGSCNNNRSIHSGSTYQMQVISPWGFGLPVTPQFSPSQFSPNNFTPGPFPIFFSNFASYEDRFANNFINPKVKEEK